jgi:hypothetical protein
VTDTLIIPMVRANVVPESRTAGPEIGNGYLYVPSSSISFSGGGNSNMGFVGCLFCNSISINGHYTFHFDEVFDKTSAADQYLPTIWQEVQ